MQYLRYYLKECIVYLKFKFNWVSCVLSRCPMKGHTHGCSLGSRAPLDDELRPHLCLKMYPCLTTPWSASLHLFDISPGTIVSHWAQSLVSGLLLQNLNYKGEFIEEKLSVLSLREYAGKPQWNGKSGRRQKEENHSSFTDEEIVTWSFLTCQANTVRRWQCWGSDINQSGGKAAHVSIAHALSKVEE